MKKMKQKNLCYSVKNIDNIKKMFKLLKNILFIFDFQIISRRWYGY